MVASETVRIAIGMPRASAVRSSASIMARAMPWRRCVGATDTALIAHPVTLVWPGRVSSVVRDALVAIGVAGSAPESSHTPIVRRESRVCSWAASAS